jgi:hypothetical protein
VAAIGHRYYIGGLVFAVTGLTHKNIAFLEILLSVGQIKLE